MKYIRIGMISYLRIKVRSITILDTDIGLIQIISMIFREELCRPPKKRSGLFVLASI